MDMSLAAHVKSGKVTAQMAYERCHDPEELQRLIGAAGGPIPGGPIGMDMGMSGSTSGSGSSTSGGMGTSDGGFGGSSGSGGFGGM
jgi:hypothetical protein